MKKNWKIWSNWRIITVDDVFPWVKNVPGTKFFGWTPAVLNLKISTSVNESHYTLRATNSKYNEYVYLTQGATGPRRTRSDVSLSWALQSGPWVTIYLVAWNPNGAPVNPLSSILTNSFYTANQSSLTSIHFDPIQLIWTLRNNEFTLWTVAIATIFLTIDAISFTYAD